ILQDVRLFQSEKKIPWMGCGEGSNDLKSFWISLFAPQKESQYDLCVDIGLAIRFAGLLQELEALLFVAAEAGDVCQHSHRPGEAAGNVLMCTDNSFSVAETGVQLQHTLMVLPRALRIPQG